LGLRLLEEVRGSKARDGSKMQEGERERKGEVDKRGEQRIDERGMGRVE